MGYFVKCGGNTYRNIARDNVDRKLYRYEESLAFEKGLLNGAGLVASEITRVLCIEKIL